MAAPLVDSAKQSRAAAKDTVGPSTPIALRVAGTSRTTIKLQWRASRDNVRVAGYRVHVNSALRATTTTSAYTVDRLTCGSTYNLSVYAYDAAGNSSSPASLASNTQPCSSTGGAAPVPPADVGAVGAGESVGFVGGADGLDVGLVGFER